MRWGWAMLADIDTGRRRSGGGGGVKNFMNHNNLIAVLSTHATQSFF